MHTGSNSKKDKRELLLSHGVARHDTPTTTHVHVTRTLKQAWHSRPASAGSASSLGHTSARDFKTSCKPHKLPETVKRRSSQY